MTVTKDVAPPTTLSFEDLSRRYNFRNTPQWRRMFTELLIQDLDSRPKPVRIIDVGYRGGIGSDVAGRMSVGREIDDGASIEGSAGSEVDLLRPIGLNNLPPFH